MPQCTSKKVKNLHSHRKTELLRLCTLFQRQKMTVMVLLVRKITPSRLYDLTRFAITQHEIYYSVPLSDWISFPNKASINKGVMISPNRKKYESPSMSFYCGINVEETP